MFELHPKAALARCLYFSGALNLCEWRRRGRLIVFNYHRIRPAGKFATPLHDGVFGPDEATFERQIAWLRANTRVLSEQDLLEILDSRRCPAEPCAMITFDDGYRDNFELALPLLLRHSAPAIFFIPDDLIAARRLGWWDVVSYLVKSAWKQEIVFEGRAYSLRARPAAIAALERAVSLAGADRTGGLLRKLAEACAVSLPAAELQDAQLMTWDHVRVLARAGMAIGSHSHTHAVLAALDGPGQRRELALSKQRLEEETGRPVHTVAYPVGGPEHFTRETCEIARECGYGAGFSFATGTNRWAAMDRFAIARVSAPAAMPLFAAKARIPDFFATR